MSDKPDAQSRTILWCVPRSVSTALARCLSAIEDNQIWFEPFCYCYFAQVEFERITGRKLPKDIRGNEQTFLEASGILQKLTRSNFRPDFISYPSIKRKLEEAASPHLSAAMWDSTEEQGEFMPDPEAILDEAIAETGRWIKVSF
eukprot:XP_011664045.1 PREDICTED: uncharacterized protein LOC105438211 [Strongylocentrotus purpuratus]